MCFFIPLDSSFKGIFVYIDKVGQIKHFEILNYTYVKIWVIIEVLINLDIEKYAISNY